eukprot:3146389-Prymnesium_polylepis.1
MAQFGAVFELFRAALYGSANVRRCCALLRTRSAPISSRTAAPWAAQAHAIRSNTCNMRAVRPARGTTRSGFELFRAAPHGSANVWRCCALLRTRSALPEAFC